MIHTRLASNFLRLSTVVLLIFLVTGCGSVQHKVDFEESYTCQENTKVKVGSVTNETGETFDLEIEKMLADALVKELENENWLWTEDEQPKLFIVSKILEYKRGDAFKRWLMPGWGATVLTIQCDLMDGDEAVGSVEAKHTVSAGGGYTIGAWKKVFANIARDIVKDLRTHIHQ